MERSLFFCIFCDRKDIKHKFDARKTDLLWQLFLGHSINQTAWYQIVLIWLTIIFVAIFHSTTRKRGEVIIGCLGIWALVFQYTGINGTLFEQIRWMEGFHSEYIVYPIGRFMEMVPYAVVGTYICQYGILRWIMKYRNKTLLGVSGLFILINCRTFVDPEGYGYSGIYKLISSILIFAFFYCMPFDILPQILQNIVKKISKYTLGIYYIHRMIGTIIYNSRLYGYFNMQAGSMHDCIVIFLISFFMVYAIYKLPIKWVKASVS